MKRLNLQQKIVLRLTSGFVLGCLVVWSITGFQMFTKTKVPMKVQDDLFGTTSIEWKNTFILGLDIVGIVTLAGFIIGGSLLYLTRTRKKL